MIDKDIIESVYNRLTQIYIDTGRPVPVTLLMRDMKIKGDEMAWILKRLHSDKQIREGSIVQSWEPTNTSGRPFFITLPDGRRVQIGRIKGEYIVCDKKNDSHITHTMFDKETINMNLEGLYRLRAMGIKYVRFNYNGKRGKMVFETEIDNFISSKYQYVNVGETQKGFPIEYMRKEEIEKPKGLWRAVR